MIELFINSLWLYSVFKFISRTAVYVRYKKLKKILKKVGEERILDEKAKQLEALNDKNVQLDSNNTNDHDILSLDRRGSVTVMRSWVYIIQYNNINQ